MRRVGVFVLVVVLGAGLVAPASGQAQAPPGYVVRGLDAPAELVVDRWGVPHIYAHSTGDAYLAQGFNAARERLFQIDLWRRRGLGQLSEAFGAAYVEQDRATRLFLYRGDLREEWESYGPDARQAATRFTQGINAYLDWLDRHPEALPEEFRTLGHQPDRWRPEDVVRIRSHGLTRNLTSEVARSKVACVAGVETDQVRVRLEPEWHTAVPDGYDPCALPDDVLDTFELATQAVEFSEGRLQAVPTTLPAEPDEALEGSNNWTIAPSRTTTGRPILANDPHRAYSAPSIRYLSHLSAPGLDVIGANEPFLPGVSIGHNGTVAFGLTIFPMDQEDLYVYELDPNDHGRYRYGDGFERIRTRTERVDVAGEEPRTVELPFTRHGPVIAVDEERHLAYAVRTAWLEPGMSPYYGSQKYLRARNFDDFTEAMRNWGAPTENQVYADTSGNIGWVPGGLAPKRQGYDGLLPVPGDGRYEWRGFHNGDDLPSSYNPEQGFIATANQFNLPSGYPHPIGFEWSNPARYERAADVLAASPHSSVADSARLQNDQLSLVAQRIVAVVRGLSCPAEVEPACRLLRDWDGVESAGSAPAALFEVWRKRHLGPGFVAATVPPEAARLISQPDTAVLLDALEHPADPGARDRLLLDTLGAAYEEVRGLLGDDPAAWQWGRLQHSMFRHPLEGELTVGPLPRGGSEHTVNASTYNTTTFEHTSGPSFRMVLDVGDWDASLAVNTPGQSGNPDSPHYRDLAEPWSTGQYVPLLYTRAAVEHNAEQRILLVPR